MIDIRTRQEEIRFFKQRHDRKNETNTLTTFEANNPSQSNSSFTLSTEGCIYVNAALLASLFIFSIARYLREFDIFLRIYFD